MISGGLKANQFTQTRLIFEAKWNNDLMKKLHFLVEDRRLKFDFKLFKNLLPEK